MRGRLRRCASQRQSSEILDVQPDFERRRLFVFSCTKQCDEWQKDACDGDESSGRKKWAGGVIGKGTDSTSPKFEMSNATSWTALNRGILFLATNAFWQKASTAETNLAEGGSSSSSGSSKSARSAAAFASHNPQSQPLRRRRNEKLTVIDGETDKGGDELDTPIADFDALLDAQDAREAILEDFGKDFFAGQNEHLLLFFLARHRCDRGEDRSDGDGVQEERMQLVDVLSVRGERGLRNAKQRRNLRAQQS